MPVPPALLALILALSALAAIAAFLVYIALRYGPIVGRIFEEIPMMQPLRAPAEPGEEVRFSTGDGRSLAGTYLKAKTPNRVGVVVFCHEFLSDRHSAGLYAAGLREAGFDLFTFDFRNHGDSETEPGLKPLQWVSDRELIDLRAALAYLQTRPDRDPAGVGLFGVSRGGGAALCVASDEPTVWGVATDGAFPTRGTMTAYILKWAEIYVGSPRLWRYMPRFIFSYVGWAGRRSARQNLGRKFPDVETAVARVSPRPWLSIHGARDAYIVPGIARELFSRAGDPKEFWLVADAKHNRCREREPEAYRLKIASFFSRYAPRRSPSTIDGAISSPGRDKPVKRKRRGPPAMARD